MIKKRLFVLIAFLQIISTATLAYENKILLKVDNEIITSIDVLNESKYIKAMNKGLQDISDEDLWRISLNSITNENRVVEILNHIEEIKVEEENLNIVMNQLKKGFNNLDDFKIF